jgi:hypothetical protein
LKDPKELPHLVRRLAPAEVYHLVAGLLNDVSLFNLAASQLRGEYFTQPFDAPIRLVWDVVTDLATKHGPLILFGDRATAYRSVEVACTAHCQAMPELCTSDVWTFLFGQGEGTGGGFLHWVYVESKPSTFDREYIGQLLVAFVTERGVNDAWRSMVMSSGENVVSNISDLATNLAGRASATSSILAGNAVKSGAPDGWIPSPSRRRPTGIAWLDRFLRGGHAAKETYLLLGAIGAGKTTFGLQLLASVAELEWLYAVSPEARDLAGLPPTESYEVGHVYYFHYEMAEEDIRVRLWSGCAKIELDRIYKLGTEGFHLSSSANLTMEEQAMLRKVREQTGLADSALVDRAFPGEVERLAQAKQLLASNLWQIDCQCGKIGQGYIPEIEAILRSEVMAGKRIAAVVIDYASACVERAQPDKDKHYGLLDAFGQLTENRISGPFNTPVWVLQQLRGVSNQRTAASRPHHSEALGCSTMGKAFQYAFSIGTADEKTGCRYFVCSKARRADLGRSPILKVAGGFNRLIDVSDEFYFDSAGRVMEKVQTGRSGGYVPGDKEFK